MLNHRWIPLALIALLLLPSTAFSQDEKGDDVTVGLFKDQVRIAIAASLPEGSAPAELGEKLAAILVRDLEISGAFELIPPETFFGGLGNEGLAVSETDFDGWYNVGAAALVKGRYSVEGETLKIDFRLYDVEGAKIIALDYPRPGATVSDYRAEVHAFANALIKHYTGVEGIFGQELLAVRRTRSGSSVIKLGVDGEGSSTVSSGSLDILPAWGPGGSALYTSFDGENWLLKRGSETIASYSGLNSGADFCPGNGRVAFTLTKDGNPEIYTMNPDGSGMKRLTENGYIDISPSWSPDCRKLAFVSNRGGSTQLYVMDADGGGARLLTTTGSYNTSPSWSPRGDKIAFTARDEYHVFDIFVVNAETGGITHRITQDQGNNEEPSWSPDGNYLVFSSTRSGSSKLYISTWDGRFQTAITDKGGYETPAWSY